MRNLDDTVEVVFYKVQSCNKSGQSCDLYCDSSSECVCTQGFTLLPTKCYLYFIIGHRIKLTC